ncbi:MAG: TIGR00730 family Rossman fold protein [Caldilineaceae bacterium]|nr:TIGR00730 family Rossman fold protein [Caldilineaceae bacterium]
MSTIQTICVFCGSSAGKRPEYSAAAQQLGQLLATERIGLVYGGGGIGLMGTIARTVTEAGGQVTGILPAVLRGKERPEAASIGQSYGELILVETMHERKATMARLSDAYIAMPGGYGTLDELFETITWGQLGIQTKPIGLLNVVGYFDGLLSWLERAISDGFVQPAYRDLIVVEQDPAALLAKLHTAIPPTGLVRLESWRA